MVDFICSVELKRILISQNEKCVFDYAEFITTNSCKLFLDIT